MVALAPGALYSARSKPRRCSFARGVSPHPGYSRAATAHTKPVPCMAVLGELAGCAFSVLLLSMLARADSDSGVAVSEGSAGRGSHALAVTLGGRAEFFGTLVK